MALLLNVRGGGVAPAGLAALTFEAWPRGAATKRLGAPANPAPLALSKSILTCEV